MLRPAYLFGTAVLAAIASTEPHDTMPASDHLSVSLQQPRALTTQRLSAPAQTINHEVSKPAQPQRWVF